MPTVNCTDSQARHEVLARRVGAWTSYTDRCWFITPYMAVRVRDPFPGNPNDLRFGCAHLDEGNAPQHYVSRLCPDAVVTGYGPSPIVRGAFRRDLQRLQRAEAVYALTIDRGPQIDRPNQWRSYYRMRSRASTDPNQWVAVDARVIDMILGEAVLPLEWRLVRLGDSMPTVVASRPGRLYGCAVPFMFPDSLLDGSSPPTPSMED